MGPGVVIGLLYARLARAYWSSQQASLPQSRRLPNPRVPCLILGIVLLFWACFLPFWLWQLLAQYRGAQPLTPRATRTVNYLTTCLTYGNSCVNPFLYTLLTKNYRQYRRRSLRPHARGAHRLAGACSFPQGRVRFQRHQQAAGAVTLPQEAPAGGRA